LKATITSVQEKRVMEEATHKEQMEVALKALAAKKAAGHSTPVTAPTGKGAGTGGGTTLAFEHHVRCLLSTGMSAFAVRDCMLMNAEFLLSAEDAKNISVPDIRWIQKQREAMGAESWLCGMMKTSRANEVLQFGFDETCLRRQSTMNQWALIRETEDSEVEVVSMETAGILVGGTSQEIADHVEESWRRGQEACKLVRAELGDDADEILLLTNGGVLLHKLQSTMHDTCNGANLAARLIALKKELSGEEYHGAEAWAAMSDEEKATTDFLCGNHSRNLPVAACSRLFSNFLTEELGADFEVAVAAGNGRARLEKDGPAFVRSIAKLAHDGYGACEKGDGKEITAFMALHDLPQLHIGRAEIASRQDWVLEISERLYPHLVPLST
jgi:hypothetical protein